MSEPAPTEETSPSEPAPRRFVSVQLRRAAATVQEFDAGALELPHGTRVVVPTEHGEALGWTVGTPQPEPLRARSSTPSARVVRVATERDLSREKSHRENEREALVFCATRARQLKLDIKLIAADWAHSNEKVTFYFASEERVDFRTLVRDLAQRLRTRVEMRVVGPRDEAKILGALGPCGRETCCSSWMRAFAPVSIKMAKDQGLALNPQSVTGVCGRLLCCLAYEQATYKDLRKGLPKIGKQVTCPRGVGKVVDVYALRGTVRVLVGGESVELPATEISPLGTPAPVTTGAQEDSGRAAAPRTVATSAEGLPAAAAPLRAQGRSAPTEPSPPGSASSRHEQSRSPAALKPHGGAPGMPRDPRAPVESARGGPAAASLPPNATDRPGPPRPRRGSHHPRAHPATPLEGDAGTPPIAAEAKSAPPLPRPRRLPATPEVEPTPQKARPEAKPAAGAAEAHPPAGAKSPEAPAPAKSGRHHRRRRHHRPGGSGAGGDPEGGAGAPPADTP